MGSPPHEDAAVAAAAAGRVRALEWCVRDNGVRPPPRAWFQAARGGHVHVLTWLHDRERERARGDVSSAWLPAPGPPPPPPPGIAALMEGAEGVLLHAPAHPEVALLHAPAHPMLNATAALAGAEGALLHVPVHPANVVATPPARARAGGGDRTAAVLLVRRSPRAARVARRRGRAPGRPAMGRRHRERPSDEDGRRHRRREGRRRRHARGAS